jgi:hypothetical protein
MDVKGSTLFIRQSSPLAFLLDHTTPHVGGSRAWQCSAKFAEAHTRGGGTGTGTVARRRVARGAALHTRTYSE